MENLHIRTIKTEFRAVTEDEKRTAAGLCVPYGVETILWQSAGYEEREVIMVGAFTESLRTEDQRALWNHDRAIVLGRKSANTLRLGEDQSGVSVEIDFPDSPEGISKHESVRRGDVSEMSFGFRDIDVKEEVKVENARKIYTRTVIKASLKEVSPVTWAAYGSATNLEAREMPDEERIRLIESKLSETSDRIGSTAVLEREAVLRENEIKLMEVHNA